LPLNDDDSLREFLANLYPGLIIDGIPAPSGQRVVYFCRFDPETCSDKKWAEWGDVVLKVSEGISNQAIAYIQREIEILKNMGTSGYPDLLYEEVIGEDPITEDRLPYRRFITIEERIESQPLSDVTHLFATEESVIELLLKLLHVLKPLWEWRPPLIHRDLKPQNILITPGLDVVVIDLGIVRVEGDAGVTYSAMPYGPCTPKYSSPEQATNDKQNITFKSDFFSLGVLCYELLSGSNPFCEEDDLIDEVLAKVIGLEPPRLNDAADCTEEFAEIISKMIEKKPYKRHRKVDDLIEALNHLKESK